MRHFLVAPALFLLLAAQSTASPAEARGKLDWLFGRWTGTGTSMGKPSQSTLHVEPALDGAFVEFRYRLTQPFTFEGRAFYQEGVDGVWSAHWFDSRKVIFPIEANVSGQALTSLWGTAETERGRTIYRILGDGRLEVVDSVLKDGKWGDFARQTFTKAK